MIKVSSPLVLNHCFLEKHDVQRLMLHFSINRYLQKKLRCMGDPGAKQPLFDSMKRVPQEIVMAILKNLQYSLVTCITAVRIHCQLCLLFLLQHILLFRRVNKTVFFSSVKSCVVLFASRNLCVTMSII